jgi:hypothetical protein
MRLCSTRGRLRCLDQKGRDDQLLVQRQFATDPLEQLDGVPAQLLEVRLARMVGLPQERDEGRRGRDRQRCRIVFG